MTDHIYKEFIRIFDEINHFQHHKCGTEFEYILPNNGNKYYILVCSVQNFKGIHAIHHSIIHNHNSASDENNQDRVSASTPKEFSIELDTTHPLYRACNGFLFEGYLYDKSDALHPYDFYISDILFTKSDNCLLSIPYETRYLKILDLFRGHFDLFNNIDLTLNIKPANPFPKMEYIDLLIQNHQHASQLTCIEYILNHMYSKENKPIKSTGSILSSNSLVKKTLFKTDKTEVIEVRNVHTNNYEGLLYIKNKEISHYLRTAIPTTGLVTNCLFNTKFNKWQPVL